MVTVFVWLPGERCVEVGNSRYVFTAWGHASIRVKNTYISWWPADDGRTKKIDNRLYEAHAIKNRSFDDDTSDEAVDPHIQLSLFGLDESAILDWWSGFLMREKWRTLTMNCSCVVRRALAIGAHDKATIPMISTPRLVARYARRLKLSGSPAKTPWRPPQKLIR